MCIFKGVAECENGTKGPYTPGNAIAGNLWLL